PAIIARPSMRAMSIAAHAGSATRPATSRHRTTVMTGCSMQVLSLVPADRPRLQVSDRTVTGGYHLSGLVSPLRERSAGEIMTDRFGRHNPLGWWPGFDTDDVAAVVAHLPRVPAAGTASRAPAVVSGVFSAAPPGIGDMRPLDRPVAAATRSEERRVGREGGFG